MLDAAICVAVCLQWSHGVAAVETIRTRAQAIAVCDFPEGFPQLTG